MSKVMTFSRTFPAYHTKAGLNTEFPQKFWMSLIATGQISLSRCCELSRETGIGNFNMNNIRHCDLAPKHHTIRAGNRWKVGDRFSPRVWGDDINPKTGRSGPYHSKQIIIGPDTEVVKTWDVEVCGGYFKFKKDGDLLVDYNGLRQIASNDGLLTDDLVAWFNKPVVGQIICWNPDINY